MSGWIRSAFDATRELAAVAAGRRAQLLAITRVELVRRYSGSLLGRSWIAIQPALLLAMYFFLFRVLLDLRFPGTGALDYALYVLVGLIPFLGLSEALGTGVACIKQNILFVKNVLVPIELLPIRSVLASSLTQAVGLAVLCALVAAGPGLGPGIAWLPVIFLAQLALHLGLVVVLASLAVIAIDVAYVLNLVLLFAMFVSPIAFRPEMVPESLRFAVYANPVTYLVESYRYALLGGEHGAGGSLAVFLLLCVAILAVGAKFFRRFKGQLVDHE